MAVRWMRKYLPLVAVTLAVFASCLPGAKQPAAKQAPRTLDLESEGASVFSNKKFRVVFASPKGEQVDPSEVTIVWNRPMRPLSLAGEESTPPASIVIEGTTTAPPGEWRWMGTSALVFAPKPALPRATPFVVTIPEGTKALDGSAMEKAFSYRFSTRRPQLVSVDPWDGFDHLSPTASFTFRFNQPVDTKEVKRATQLLLGGDRKPASFSVAYKTPEERQLVVVKPDAPLPLASSILLMVDASVRGTEGPLPAGKPFATTLSTYGPLVAKDVRCSQREGETKCAPGRGVSIELSNRVKVKDLPSHVRIEPPLPMKWAVSSDDTDTTDWVSVPASLHPSVRYRVIVTAGLKDEYGQTMGRDYGFDLETRDFDPTAMLGVSGEVFEAGKKRAVPVTSVNVPSFELVTATADPMAILDYVTVHEPDAYARAKAMPGASVTNVAPTAAKNIDDVHDVSWDTLFGAGGKGAAVIGISYQTPGYRMSDPPRTVTDARVLASTDLALSGKLSRFGSLVWVTRLSSGQPVANATVSVLRRGAGEVLSVPTDQSGIAAIPADRYVPVKPDGQPDDAAILVAREGDDWGFRRVADMLDSWRAGVSIDTAGRLDPFGMVFTERGVYRPGETVKGTAIFRAPLARGTETPAGRPVHLVAFDGQGEKILDTKGALDAFGEIAIDVPVPASAHLGTGEIRAELGSSGEGAHAAIGDFELAAYRAAEFKVSVDPSAKSFIRGDRASFGVRGDYLFGAPMSAGGVTYTVTRGSGWFSPPGAEELVVDDYTYSSDIADTSARGGRIQDGTGTLDAKGVYDAAVSLPMPEQHGPEMVSLEAEVADVSRQTIAGRASVIVHPGEFYLAMKPQAAFFVDKGTRVHQELEAIEPSGAVRPGVGVHLEAIKRTWRSVIEASGEDGEHYESKPSDRVVATCELKTGTTFGGCDLRVDEIGYFIIRATAKDRRGNPLASSESLYVVGEGGAAGWAMNDTTKLELVADKKTYEIGDTARILVKSPFSRGQAIVTVERAGVYTQQALPLSGATPTISVPITEDMRPNAYVAVQLVRARSAPEPARGGPDVGAPAYRLGYAELTVNPEARRFKVAVSPARKDYRPGEDVDVDLSVTDRAGAGAKAAVTFYAVDEGVLMLTGYKTPDPIPVFTAPRPLSVWALESREDLGQLMVSRIAGSGTDKGDEGGGGSGAPGKGVRSDFRATAYFAPKIETGADGKAHTRFKLPDNLTTFRLMAVATGQDDRFGWGESQIATSRPLMARPELPRFLRAGDAMEAGVVLSSKGMPAGDVEVTIATHGARVAGEATKVVAVPAGGNVEVRWAIATPDVGDATFEFHAAAGAEKDSVSVKRAVEVPLSPEAVALAGQTDAVADERLGDLRAARPDVGELDVKLASTALVGIDDGADQLIEYPYGCTEQLTSRLVPLVPLRSLATDFGMKLPANVGAIVDDAIAKVLANQRGDGGFGYWPDSEYSDPWVSAYALWGLDVAKRGGHHVPVHALDAATAYVRKVLNDENTWPYRLALVDKAFIVDVLAELGQPDPGAVNRVYEHRADLPLFGRALLAHAMAGSKMDPRQAVELLRDLDAHLRVTPTGATVVENQGGAYAPLLDSEARTTAMVLRALVAVDPHNALLGRLAHGLLGVRRGGRWRSTQEAAWALLSLDDYRHVAEKKEPDYDARVSMNDVRLLDAPFHGRSAAQREVKVPMAAVLAKGAGKLSFDVDGGGDLFYEARLTYAKRELPVDGLERGLFVRKLVRSVSPEGLSDALRTLPDQSATQAKAGDLVLVDLIVVTPDPREQVVIDDPLPAGLEAVQAGFDTTAQTLSVAEPGAEGDQVDEEANDDVDARAAGRTYNASYYHREIKDDRVLTFVEHMSAGVYHYRYLARATTIGTFVVPPTRAECMYEPETFGRTGAGTFEVKAQ